MFNAVDTRNARDTTLLGNGCRTRSTVGGSDTATVNRLDSERGVPSDRGRFVWSLSQGPAHDPALVTLSIRVICTPRTERISVYSTTDAIFTSKLRRHTDINPQLLRDTQAYLRSRARRQVPDGPLCWAWQKFYTDYHPLIRRVVRISRIPEAERENCVQEIWVAIISNLASLDLDPQRGGFLCWLFTLIHRHVVNVVRRTAKGFARNMGDWMFTLFAKDGDPAKASEDRQVRQIVHAALDQLQRQVSVTNFRVLQLSLIEDHAILDVAARLDLSSGQVRNRLRRCKCKIRGLLKARSLCETEVAATTTRGPMGRRGKNFEKIPRISEPIARLARICR
jgi:RNA polymerase sigma factor (sigma-70 family)